MEQNRNFFSGAEFLAVLECPAGGLSLDTPVEEVTVELHSDR